MSSPSAPLDADRLAAARLWATARAPYLASAIFASPTRSDPGSTTIAIDRGWTVAADPAVVDTLEVEQLGRLLIHLCGHTLRDHGNRARRLGVSDSAGGPGRFNRAADAELNDDLAADGLIPACAPDTPDALGCPAGRLAEAYYADQSDGPRHWDCGAGADGCDRPGDATGDGIDPRQGEMLRLAVAAEIQRAHAREPGTVAGGWLRWAETVLPSRTDWRRVLAAEVRAAVASVAGAVDYSHQRPSRRADAHPDVVMATLVRPVPEVAIVCDTSGSMHERLLARALAEIDGVLTRAGLARGRVRVLAVDTMVHTVRRVMRAEQVVLAGGGGTDMGAGIEAAAALRPRPTVVIVVTDGYTGWPQRPPPGIRVVAALLAEDRAAGWQPPSWVRTVIVEDR